MSEWRKVKIKEAIEKVVDNRGKTPPISKHRTSYELLEVNSIVGTVREPNYEAVNKFVDKNTYDTWFRSGHPQTGDVIVSTVGSIGELAILNDDRGSIAQNLVALRPKRDVVNPDFFFYLMKSPTTKSRLLSLDISSVQPSIKVPHLLDLEIIIPSNLGYQKAISDIFVNIDKKIELNRKMSATLEAMARALFKSWFVDFDPVRAKSEGREPFGMDAETAALFPSRLVPSALGDIPEGWGERKIGDIVETISKTYPLHTVSDVIFLNTGDIQNGKFFHSNKSPVSSLPGQAKKSIQRDDILYSEIRPENKRFAFVHFESSQYVVSTKLMVLRATNQAQALFAYFVLSDQSSVDFLQMMAESRSGTFPQITYDVLSRIAFIAPCDNELIELLAKRHLEPVHEKMLSNDKETLRLEKLRDYLLPKLISGEIRIPDAERMVGGVV